MTDSDRNEFFKKLRLKLDEIDDLMDAYGGKEDFTSLYCFGSFIPGDEVLDTNDKYEFMCGMHMAAEEEFELMINSVVESYNDYFEDEEDSPDSSTINYWLN